MSMPAFPDPSEVFTQEEALNALLTSIALEETALSHILNAEGEKIQYALSHINQSQNPDIQLALKVNESAASMLEHITDMQLVLVNKLNKVLRHMPRKADRYTTCLPPDKPVCKADPEKSCPYKPASDKPCPYKPLPDKFCKHKPLVDKPSQCKPVSAKTCQYKSDQDRPAPSSVPCVSAFSAKVQYSWGCKSPLALNTCNCCDDGVEIYDKHGGSLIALPAGRRYKIELHLELSNRSGQPVSLEAKLVCGSKEVYTNQYMYKAEKKYIQLKDTFIWEVPSQDSGGLFMMNLLSPGYLKIYKGRISIAGESK